MDYPTLCQMLNAFLSEDNTTRKAAEAAFEAQKASNSDNLVLQLLEVIQQNPEDSCRQQAAIAIRNLLRDFVLQRAENLWMRLQEPTKATLKNALLVCIERERSKVVRRSICDTITEIASELVPQGGWPDLPAKLMTLLQSTETTHQAAGLKMLGELVPQLASMINEHVDGVKTVIERSFATDDVDVRFEGLGLLSAIVQNERRGTWKKLQSLVPAVVETLKALTSKEGTQEHVKDYLIKLIDIAESEAGFFKPHLNILGKTLFEAARNSDLEDETRQLVVEVLLCLVEDKPMMCLKIPGFVNELVQVLMEFMLGIEDDTDWIDQEDGQSSDETRNYDVGESGIDRVASALGGEAVMPVVFSLVGQYLQKGTWEHKFVAIMAVSQTVEYLPEDDIESHLEQIVDMLLTQLKDAHHRVRFAACQAIGQIALDHQPFFQQTYASQILPALIQTLDDPVGRVQGHAAAALVNFAEEVDASELLPVADVLMDKFFQRIALTMPRVIREQCVTGIAVIAGVIEGSFVKYYPLVMPRMKEIISKCTSKEERTCRGKAVECISIIGLSVGAETFGPDAAEAMSVMLALNSGPMEEDDPVKEYVQEALRRMCRTLKQDFLQYIPVLLPGVFQLLNVKPFDVNEDEVETSEHDMTLVSLADGKYSGLKTSVIEDMIHGLELLTTYLEVLGGGMRDWLEPSANALLPLLHFRFSDDVKRCALNAVGELLGAGRSVTDAHQEFAAEGLVQIGGWLALVLESVFKNLDEEDDGLQVDLMTAETGGLARCLKNAGSNILNGDQVKVVCERIFKLMQESSQRRAEIAARKQDPDFDEEDVEKIQEEETSEQTFRSTLLEVIAALMKHHPEQFLQSGVEMCMQFVQTFLHPNCSADDRALALYVCDDVLEHLGDAGALQWPRFLQSLIDSTVDPDCNVRQAACYGIIQAAKCSQFSAAMVQQSVQRIIAVLNNESVGKKDSLAATDNAIAALGALVFHQSAHLQPDVEKYLQVWLEKLPLKMDEEEGRRVHAELVTLVAQSNPMVLGVNSCNLPRIVGIFASIYKTAFSAPETNEEIRKLMLLLGQDNLKPMVGALSRKQQRALERIFKDIASSPTNKAAPVP